LCSFFRPNAVAGFRHGSGGNCHGEVESKRVEVALPEAS